MKELDIVALAEPLSEFGLDKGALGTVVFVHSGGEACIVEFMTLGGKKIAVSTLRSTQVRRVELTEMAYARAAE